MPKQYNTTQLTPGPAFERHIYHRDMFAHYFRWTHLLRIPLKKTILDFGCGSGELAEVLYRNRRKQKLYKGFDIRKAQVNKNNEKFTKQDWITFEQHDLCDPKMESKEKFDYICSFEVAEHIGKYNIDKFLTNMIKFADKNTTIFISTPCYDEKVGAAKNHMIYNPTTKQKEVGEFKYNELKTILEKYFVIEKQFGTFASIKDYKPHMNDWQKNMFNHLKEYYDVNLLSALMAPFFPKHSRNCLWVLKLKPEPKKEIKRVIVESDDEDNDRCDGCNRADWRCKCGAPDIAYDE